MRFILLIAYLTAFAWLFESHAQQNINSLTSKQIIVNGKIEVNSTSQSSKPCPAMTEAQRDAISSPVSGSCVYNTNTLTLNIYNGTIWKSAGGGISNWETAFNYAINDVVIESNKIYQCNTAHTSTTFSSDIANWTLISDNLPVSLTSDVTGVLPMASGGTDKNLTPVLGGVVYTDAGSMEVLGAGTSGQVLKSNGAAAPSWENASNKVQGQDQTEVDFTKIQFPNKSVSEISSGVQLVETGNVNLFVNANFEASPDFSGHTNSGTGTFVMETSAASLLEGNKTGKFQCAPTTVCSSSQTQTIKAGQANLPAMISIVAEAGGEAVEFCAIVDSIERGCIPVTTKGSYKIPVITGTTNLGYILRQNSTASPLNIRYDQVKAEIKDTTELAPIVGPRVAYTPTFTGFGTVTNVNCYGQQIGPSELIGCTFASGTPTGVEARVSLRSGLSSSANLPSVSVAGGPLVFNATNLNGYVPLIEPNVSYITFGLQNNSPAFSGLSKLNGNGITSGAATYSFTAIVPIAQYQASVPTYSDRCRDQINCETEPAFSRDTSNVISSVFPFGTSFAPTCTGTTTVTCNITSGNFSVTPKCWARRDGTSQAGLTFEPSSTSTTSVVIPVIDTTLSPVNSSIRVYCQRQGQDYINAKVNQIVGSFKDYVKTPNTATGKVGFCSAKISATGVISDQLGGCFASCTNATTPVCTFTSNYWRSGSVPNCWHIAVADAFTRRTVNLTSSQFAGTITDNTGTPVSGDREYFCHGEIQ